MYQFLNLKFKYSVKRFNRFDPINEDIITDTDAIMHTKFVEDKYILRYMYPPHYNIPIDNIFEVKLSACLYNSKYELFSSMVIKNDHLKKFIEKNDFALASKYNPIYLNTKVYMLNSSSTDLFPAEIMIDKDMLPVFIDVELPKKLCDEWYKLYIRRVENLE